MNISKNAAIESFTNTDTIESKSCSGIFTAGANIKTLINKGNIISEGDNNLHAGVKLNEGTIESIINTGTIRGNNFGFAVSIGKFGKFSMQDGAIVIGKYSGIIVGNNQTLGELEISGANTRISGDDYGIWLNRGTKTEKVTVKDGARSKVALLVFLIMVER